MSDLPAPMTPPDCDLKDFPHTPIYRARLRGSSFNAKASDAEWRAGVNLWLNAQDQVPAGSLPDDDTELCRLADLGRDTRSWKKVKEMALHGWCKCSDGRLYNKTVAEVVNKQWQSKIDQRNKTLKARIAALQKRLDQAADQSIKDDITDQIRRLQQGLKQWQSQLLSQAEETSVTEREIDCDRDQEKRREGEGKDKRLVLVPLAKANGRESAAGVFPGTPTEPDPLPEIPEFLDRRKPETPAAPKPKIDPWKAVYDRGKEVLGREAGGIITNLRKTFEDKPRKVLAKIEDAAEKRNPIEWINAFLWEHGPAGIEVGAIAPLP